MATRSPQKYTEENIKRLKGLEGVRLRPGMYLGERGDSMVFQVLKEVIDNCYDEFTSGRNKFISVFADNKTNTFVVADKAQGIPVGLVPSDPENPRSKKVSTLTLIFTELHTGGKFDDKAYKTSKGCFVGSQKVSLLNGEDVAFSDLYEKFSKDKKPFYVYSFDINGQTAFVPRLCTQVHKTMLTRQLCDVTLDTGEVVRCTPDHPFLTFEGLYVEAQYLEEGQRLRALYLSFDKDGYEVHNYRNCKPTTRLGNAVNRTQRTVVAALGHCVEGAAVHHKNGRKIDNRPKNLEVIHNKSEHFWEDYALGKHQLFVNKNKRLRKVSSANMSGVNTDLENGFNAQVGKIIQCAARAIRDYGKLSTSTYNKCRGWCYPSIRVIPHYFTKKELYQYARQYLRKYGPAGRTNNGGQGLDYKLLSEYSKNPVDNIANHFVSKVRMVTLDSAVPVYDLTVDGEHNYRLAEGIFVHNTHGVGAAASNAVCSSFEVWSHRDRAWHYQQFKQGKPVAELKKITKLPVALTSVLNYKPMCGSIVRLSPDLSIVSQDGGKTRPKLNLMFTADWLKSLAQLNAGLEVTFSANGKSKTFLNTKGLPQIIADQLAEVEADPLGRPFIYDSPSLSVALQWSSYPEDDALRAYVESGLTRDGGEHEVGLRNSLNKALTPYKKKTDKFAPKDIYYGMLGIINWRMSGAEYSGQTKDRLTSNVAPAIEQELLPELTRFFTKYKTTARLIIRRAMDVKKSKDEFKKTLDAVASAKRKSKNMLPAGLVQANKASHLTREVYVVEGDSAGGSSKKARDPRTQEVLKLTGKIANSAKMKLHKLMESKAIQDILVTIGYNFNTHKQEGVEHKLRVNKIFLLPDADVDGQHITVLLLTLLNKLMPELFAQGRVYIVDAPLFSAYYKNTRYLGETLAEVRGKIPKGAKVQIMRSKGWGEISYETLSVVAFNPATRTVIQVKPVKGKELQYFNALVGNDSLARKELLGL